MSQDYFYDTALVTSVEARKFDDADPEAGGATIILYVTGDEEGGTGYVEIHFRPCSLEGVEECHYSAGGMDPISLPPGTVTS